MGEKGEEEEAIFRVELLPPSPLPPSLSHARPIRQGARMHEKAEEEKSHKKKKRVFFCQFFFFLFDPTPRPENTGKSSRLMTEIHSSFWNGSPPLCVALLPIQKGNDSTKKSERDLSQPGVWVWLFIYQPSAAKAKLSAICLRRTSIFVRPKKCKVSHWHSHRHKSQFFHIQSGLFQTLDPHPFRTSAT